MENTGPSGSTSVHPQNLNDLQNYLVTFNKEIEGTEDSGLSAGQIQVHASTDGNNSEPVYIAVTEQQVQEVQQKLAPAGSAQGFTESLFQQQDIVEMRDEGQIAEGIQTFVVTGGIPDETDIEPDQKPGGLDADVQLSVVHAQLAELSGNRVTATPVVRIPASSQGGMVTVNVPVSGGGGQTMQKIVHVVSMDGQETMQFIDAGSQHSVGQEVMTVTQNVELDDENGLDPLSINQAVSQQESGGINGADPVAVLASVAANTSNANAINQLQTIQLGHSDLQSAAQLVALQNSADSSQPQLVAVQGQDGSGDTLQLVGSSEGGLSPNQIVLNTGNSYQTVTIMPSEVSQGGEVSYVLIVSQPDGDKEGETRQIALDMSVYDFKEEHREITEEIIEEDGTTKRIVKITPKKLPIAGLSNNQLMCHYCNYTSPKRYLLTRHMKSHSDERPHRCNICNRGFKTLASLQNHVNTHTGTRPHKCKMCESAFTTSGELVRHVRYRHTFEKPHKCTECDYCSVELSKLKRHMRSHTGERPYQCPHCTYASPDTYKLKRHLRIHTGEKPYECDVCHARFTQSNSLKAHKLIHSGNKPIYHCELCPTTCGRKTDLKIHIQKLHTSEKPLMCSRCGQTFPDRYSYKLHIKSHDGEKCFNCEHCDYAALSQRHLESHLLTHSGEKPFECDECDQSFRQKQLLKRHKNLYHTPDYEPPLPRDKMHDCGECEKSFAHKGNLMRHMQQHDPESPLYKDPAILLARRQSMDGMGDGQTPLTAEQLLQSSILSDLREGKLGNSPKVVIVHPDGRVEEVTAKLQSMNQERAVDELLPQTGETTSEDSLADNLHDVSGESEHMNGEEDSQNVVTTHNLSAHMLPQDLLTAEETKDAETQVALESDSEDEEEEEEEHEEEGSICDTPSENGYIIIGPNGLQASETESPESTDLSHSNVGTFISATEQEQDPESEQLPVEIGKIEPEDVQEMEEEHSSEMEEEHISEMEETPVTPRPAKSPQKSKSTGQASVTQADEILTRSRRRKVSGDVSDSPSKRTRRSDVH